MQDTSVQWSSKRAFLYAAVGAAVGLGNIWRFPYMAGENGGGAFVLIYLFFVACLCVPLVVTELYIGQQGKRSPIGSMRQLCKQYNVNPVWTLIGINCLLISFLVFSFYSVIASWSMDYIASYLYQGQEAIVRDAPAHFKGLLASPERLIGWQSLLIFATAAIVAFGIRGGLEKALKLLVPGLFFILILLVILGAFVGDFAASVDFLLKPDFSRVTAQTWLMALGQAFFSVAIGGGSMMVYGAYLPEPKANTASSFSLIKLAVIICIADTLVALLAGFAIFPFVFANHIDPQAGAGLIFIALPTAFAEFAGGQWLALTFFVLLVFAALSTTIAFLEPLVAYFKERFALSRGKLAWLISIAIWLVGILQSLSFNHLKDWHPLAFLHLFENMNLFSVTDLFASTLLLPFNCLLIALFVGWVLLRKQTGTQPLPKAWLSVVKYPAPFAIVAVLVFGLLQH
ncbi:sodium-dependent transporter [Alteromonas sp. a30]|uniref:sodium-dependent transporter n=1 Tax=Alteromonas sp. a30 TaxID=2730917 RepID=UPI00227D9B1E|nr:sodium-dependent transporter [Alteromonas sp. a30]MCY7295519.1 sodium-dependent transporter [Alteromonas sp. a30]